MSCSKKYWAYTFVGFGGTFLVIGIVCGFVIPKIVIGIVEDKACIDSEADSDYDDWVKEKTDSRITKLYYWEITNKQEFLYNGELPKLKERGPYVYKQTSQAIDVSFKDDQRTSTDWLKDAKFFKDESCKNCSENDEITILNLGYLGLMEKIGGDENFAFASLPGTISVLLVQFNHSYEELGNVNQTEWKDPLNSGWTRPGFGAFIQKNFSAVKMKGLYNVLGSAALLFGETSTNTTSKEQCKLNPVQKKCGFLAHMKTVAGLNQTDPEVQPLKTNLMRLINHTLCPNTTTKCFGSLDVHSVNSILGYIQHVSKYTMQIILGKQDEIVQTLPQNKIALGYSMLTVRDPTTKKIVAVPGIVKNYTKQSDAKNESKSQTLYTCEAGDDKKHQWAAYDGKAETSAIPNMTKEDSLVRGYSLIVPRSETADKPCAFTHELPYNSLEIFVSALGMRVRVRYTGETSLHGLDLKRFTPNKDDFLRNSGVHQGYIAFTTEIGFTTYLSFAHLLDANVTVPKSFNQKPDVAKHQSIVDIEPVTGILARAFMRIQVNVPIMENYVKVARINGPLNISYLAEEKMKKLYLKSIPVLWGEYGGQAGEDDIDTIKKEVIGALGLACGILIALPVLGGIFIIVGIVLFVIGAKANSISELSSK